MVCIFPSAALTENQFASDDNANINSNGEALKHETFENFTIFDVSKSKILTVFGACEIFDFAVQETSFPSTCENATHFLTPENQGFSRISRDKNISQVNAAYLVTIKKKVKVYYTVKIPVKSKVKVWYKYRGNWKSTYEYKYSYRYVYRYYYKYVYKTYKVRNVPPSECKKSTKNAQSYDLRIKALAKSLTPSTKNVTVPNPSPKPTAPIPVKNPITVVEPGSEPQIADFSGNKTAYQEAWNAWNKTNTSYNIYLKAKQKYSQYLLDYASYKQKLSQYKENITVTKKLTTLEKATNIFNWVRDYVNYSFYYNTKRGAVGTLKYRLGNCVDLSHLMVALSRAAGIPARYVHASCKFSSGWCGHVWAQLYVNGKWINADASNNINDFGVIRNWNIKNDILKGVYSSLPF
ncbi:transglutaminase-like domain-containing protein [Methanobacterium sp.]|uniref:transglutaminase-like domain-containing protein n=1 Tax=Methanobacterium sp. TaxID=2164 RepID=UPI003C751D08